MSSIQPIGNVHRPVPGIARSVRFGVASASVRARSTSAVPTALNTGSSGCPRWKRPRERALAATRAWPMNNSPVSCEIPSAEIAPLLVRHIAGDCNPQSQWTPRIARGPDRPIIEREDGISATTSMRSIPTCSKLPKAADGWRSAASATMDGRSRCSPPAGAAAAFSASLPSPWAGSACLLWPHGHASYRGPPCRPARPWPDAPLRGRGRRSRRRPAGDRERDRGAAGCCAA